uniref:HMG box domain-containing protein n=1 Tax=Anser cygnoides TaxID=8845 RepID=A0A8B9IR21_ANSCY
MKAFKPSEPFKLMKRPRGAMAPPAGAPRGPQRHHLLFYVSIKKKAEAGQEPAAGARLSQQRSETWKAVAMEEKEAEDMVEQQEAAKRRRRKPRSRGRFSRTKQPLPAFFLFMAQHRPELRKSNPHWTAAETAMKLGKIWHEQPEVEKEMYKQQAARLRGQKQARKAQRSGCEPGKELTAEKMTASFGRDGSCHSEDRNSQ